MTRDIVSASASDTAPARPGGRGLPIAVLLGGSLGALVLVAAASVLTISIASGIQSTTRQLTAGAVLAIETVEQRLEDHLSPVAEQVVFVRDLIESGRLDPTDTDRLRDVFTGAVAATPQVDGIVFFDRALMMRGVLRRGARWIEIDRSADARLRRQIAEAERGLRAAHWLGLLWSPDLGQTIVVIRQPLYVDGRFIGTLGAGVTISELSRFVAGFGQETFILRGPDGVVAHSALIEGADGLSADRLLPEAGQLGDPVLAAMWRQDRWVSEPDDLVAETSGYAIELDLAIGSGDKLPDRPAKTSGHAIELDGEIWYFVYRTIRDYGAEPWTVGQYYRQSDLGREFERLFWAAAVGLGVVVIAIFAAFYIGHRIGRPVRLLAHSARRIGDLEFEGLEPLGPSRLRELDDAANAFNLMLRGLRWFESYVPRKLVRRLVSYERDAAFDSEERAVTVMFTDIAGFTRLAEDMAPAETAAFLNHHFGLITECVEDEGGTVDKYIGDALMAFWGAPERQTDHASRACRAALAIARAVMHDNADRQAQGASPIRLRIGVHSGPAVVGNIGAPDRINYTIVGDTVNICQRIEGLGKSLDPGDGDVVIHLSGAARALLGAQFSLADCGAHALAGRSGEIEVFRLDGVAAVPPTADTPRQPRGT